MIIYDPKNWFRILLDFPKSPVFRTLAMDVVGAGLWARLCGLGRDRLDSGRSSSRTGLPFHPWNHFGPLARLSDEHRL